MNHRTGVNADATTPAAPQHTDRPKDTYTRDELRIAYYKGVLKGADEPNISVEDLKAAAAEAIEAILDKRRLVAATLRLREAKTTSTP